MVVADVRG